MQVKKIYINPGHQGISKGLDPGAAHPGKDGKWGTADDRIEAKMNLDVALRLRDLLVADGHEIIMSRVGDSKQTLNETCREAKRINADISISIHHNAGGGRGAEVLFPAFTPDRSKYCKQLAESILFWYRNIGPVHGSGIGTRVSNGRDSLAVLREFPGVVVLTEGCFLDSSDYDSWSPESEATALYRGIRDYIK